MKNTELEQIATNTLCKFYKQNTSPLSDILAEDAVYFSSLNSTVMENKTSILNFLNAEIKNYICSLGPISVYDIQVGRNVWEIVLDYDLTATTADKCISNFSCRTQMTFRLLRERTDKTGNVIKSKYNLFLINHSFINGKKATDSGLDDQMVTEFKLNDLKKASDARVLIRGTNGNNRYLATNDILYIKSTNGGRHSCIYTTDGCRECSDKVSFFSDTYTANFIKAHASYVINPVYAKELMRFKLTLTDGTVIPVPEKKYTAFKKSLNQWTVAHSL